MAITLRMALALLAALLLAAEARAEAAERGLAGSLGRRRRSNAGGEYAAAPYW